MDVGLEADSGMDTLLVIGLVFALSFAVAALILAVVAMTQARKNAMALRWAAAEIQRLNASGGGGRDRQPGAGDFGHPPPA
jgi:hypothetical protein